MAGLRDGVPWSARQTCSDCASTGGEGGRTGTYGSRVGEGGGFGKEASQGKWSHKGHRLGDPDAAGGLGFGLQGTSEFPDGTRLAGACRDQNVHAVPGTHGDTQPGSDGHGHAHAQSQRDAYGYVDPDRNAYAAPSDVHPLHASAVVPRQRLRH